jgi:hypothetical protein
MIPRSFLPRCAGHSEQIQFICDFAESEFAMRARSRPYGQVPRYAGEIGGSGYTASSRRKNDRYRRIARRRSSVETSSPRSH